MAFLTEIADNSQNVKTFQFDKDGIQDLELAGSDLPVSSLRGHGAKIQNKYYNASLYFIDLNHNIPLDSIPQDYFHGTIVYFDNNDKDSYDFARSYVVESNIFLEDSSVKLLVCDTARESDCEYFSSGFPIPILILFLSVAVIPRLEIQKLCIDNGFELVELNPEIEEEDEEDLEDDFKETLSFPRIYQALEANVWPHLQFVADCSKGKHNDGSSKAGKNSELNEQKVDEFEKLLYQFQDFKGKLFRFSPFIHKYL